MVDYKPRWFPQKLANLRQEANDWGTHDKVLFTPAEDIKLRCFRCNVLMESGILSTEGACIRCNYRFKKNDVRDMFVEAKQVQVMGGWTREMLDDLFKLNGPGTVRPDGSVRAVGEVARNLTAMQLRQKKAQMRVVRALRNQSNISKILSQGPE